MSQYLKQDCELGYIEDNAEIEKLKFDNLRHVVLGCMLGDFDEVGTYVVSPEIVAELISMEKYLVDSYDNIELCKSALKLDKQISFMVTFEGNRATLSLVEKINYEANFLLNSGTYSNINEFVLDVVETSGEVNRNVLYDRWNIKVIPGEIIDIFNCDDAILEKFFGITNRFKYLLKTNRILLEKEVDAEEVEASYTNEVLKVISHYPKLETQVMEAVKKTLTEKKGAVSVKKPFFAKTFNEVLENAIVQNLSTLTELEKEDFNVEKRNAIVNLNIKRDDLFETSKIEIDDNEKEISPKVMIFKTENQNKSIAEFAQEFASVHKQVQNRVAGENSIQPENDLFRRTIIAVGEKKGVDVDLPETANNAERNKLLETIKNYGIANLIDIEEEKTEKKIEKVATSTETQTAPVKKISGGDEKDKKATKKPDKKKDNGKKPAKKETEKKDDKKNTEEKKEKVRVYNNNSPLADEQKDAENKKVPEQKNRVDARILSNEEMNKILNQTGNATKNVTIKTLQANVNLTNTINNNVSRTVVTDETQIEVSATVDTGLTQ